MISNSKMMDSPGFDMPLSRTLEEQTDPFNTSIVDDLLSSLTDWRGVNDIVRLTLRALTDAVKAQTASIREFERIIPNKADWSEVAGELSLKANISEVSRSLGEVSDELQSKVRLTEVQRLLEDKVSRVDLQYAMGTKVSVEEFRLQLDQKAGTQDVEVDYRDLLQTVQKLKDNEITHLFKLVDTKAGIQEVCEALDQKANLSSFTEVKKLVSEVHEGLQTKVRLTEVQRLLEDKVSRVDLLQALGTKVSVEEFRLQLDSKASANEVDLDYRELQQSIQRLKDNEISHLSKLVDTKAGKQIEFRLDEQFMELENFLASIKSEFDGMYSALSNSVSRKADYKCIEEINGKISNLVEFEFFESTLNQVKADVQAKVDRVYESSNVEGRLNSLEQLKHQVFEVTAFKKSHEQQLEDFKRHIVEYCGSLSSDFTEDIKSLKGDLSTLCETQQEILLENENRFRTFKSQVDSLSSDIRTELAAIQKDLNREFIKVKEETEARLSQHDQAVERLVKHKPDTRELELVIEKKADAALIQHLNNLIETQKQSQSDFNTNIASKQYLFEGKLVELSASLTELSGSQASTSAIAKSLEQKVDVRDFKRTAGEFKDQLKIVSEDFQSHLSDQTLINETLCSENVVARWAWKSSTLSGAIVPWEEQSVNTCPENFLWTKDTTNIITVAPGLYEVIFGFFARQKPTITLLVNGEPVLQRVVRTVKPSRSQHPISGVTQVEFLALPSRASVSVNYAGEPGEGFIGLKKL